MEFSDYLISSLPGIILELVAALAGIYYLRRKFKPKRMDYYLVIFLWYTFFVEIIASYAPIAYFSDYSMFSFVKDTLFEANYWWFNIYLIVNFTFLTCYFRARLKNPIWNTFIWYSILTYIILSIVNLVVTDVFFRQYSQFSILVGSFLLFLSIGLFYFELLKSDTILQLKRYLPFYISVGALVFYICNTPIAIFSEFFEMKNELFVNLQINVLFYTNIFMYSTFIIGFILCSGKKKSY